MTEKKTERRFRLLDFAIIFLALFAVIGVWQRNNLKNLFEKEEILENYVVTFEVKCVRSTTAELLQKDVAFYTESGDQRILLGTLTESVSAWAARVELPHPDPARGMVTAVYPQDEYEYLQDIQGVLSCKGLEHDGLFFIGGEMILSKGQQIVAKTETVDIVITVTDYRTVG